MPVRGPPNLRRWLGWGVTEAGKLGYGLEKSFELAHETVSGDTINIMVHDDSSHFLYTVFQKKEATKLLAVTLSNLNRF